MARPKKNNADYFSHDADMRNDVKVKALRRRFSHKGYAVWCFILEALTDSDFFELSLSDVNRELLAADFDVSTEELQEIIDYCVKIGLLQESGDNGIFSEAHQRRFSGLLNKRERDAARISGARISQREGFRGDNPQSKVKESKEEKSKEKVNIVYPYEEVVNLWNATCISLPKVAKLNDRRRQKIKCRLEEFGFEPETWHETVGDLFRRVQGSDFLTGRNKNNWTASFDWLFENSTNWVKVWEGNYDNNRGQKASQNGSNSQNVQLGVGEYMDGSGRRTYGSGRATIPVSAPPRPSERHQWSAETNNWIIL